MSTEIESMADRVRTARDRLRAQPPSDSHAQGPPDPKSGDRWDRFNVLGHTAEMLEFWSKEIPRAVAAGDVIGREPGSSGRLDGIEAGRLVGEEKLRERIDAGCDSTLAALATFNDADLDRRVETRVRGELSLREVLETYLVGHLEEHVTQLTELPQT